MPLCFTIKLSENKTDLKDLANTIIHCTHLEKSPKTDLDDALTIPPWKIQIYKI